MTSLEKITLVDVVFDTDDPLYFKGKKVDVESGTGFVNFVGLVKVVCRHDQNNLNSERFWKRLNPEIAKSDSKVINKMVYISPSAVDKLVEQNRGSCRKTWGVFAEDGFRQFQRDLRLCKRAEYSSPVTNTRFDTSRSKRKQEARSPGAATNPSSSKKVRVLLPEDDKITEEQVIEFLDARQASLNERERSLNEREVVIASREHALSNREILMIQREIECAEKQKAITKEQLRLDKKKTDMSGTEEMSVFFEKIASLTNKFKAKRQASCRNSSDDEDTRSPTPEETVADTPFSPKKRTPSAQKRKAEEATNKKSPTTSSKSSPSPRKSLEHTPSL